MNELSTGMIPGSNRLLNRPIKAVRFLLFETGAYENQYRRPYTTLFDESKLDVFREQLDGNVNYRPQALTGIATSFVVPSTSPELNIDGSFKQVTIPNDWHNRRYRFMMEFEYETYVGNMVLIETLTGYTSHPGGHMVNGLRPVLDPNLDFYVNSTITRRSRVEYGPVGQMSYSSQSDNSHLLVANGFPGEANLMYREGDRQHYMRPTDVFSTMQTSFVKGYGGTHLDGRTLGGNNVQKSRRSNGVSAEYMSTIMRSMKNAQLDEQVRGEASEHKPANAPNKEQAARNYAMESMAANDTVLKMFSDRRGIPITNHFTFGELQALAPNIMDVAEVRISSPTQQLGGHAPGDTTHWEGGDYNTVSAATLSQSVPAIMTDCLLTRMVCNFNNYGVGGQVLFTYSKALSFVDEQRYDIRAYIERFEERVNNLILFEMSLRNLMKFNIDIDCDLYGETVIGLQFENDGYVQFCTPSFADALFSPVVTVDQSRAETVAQDFTNLLDYVMPAEIDAGVPIMSHKRANF